MTLTITKKDTRKLYHVKEVPALPEFAWLTESTLRHMIFHSRERKLSNGTVIKGNGMLEAGVIKHPYGNRILIDVENFRQWLEQNTNPTSTDL